MRTAVRMAAGRFGCFAGRRHVLLEYGASVRVCRNGLFDV